MPDFPGTVTVSPTNTPNQPTITLSGGLGRIQAYEVILENVVYANKAEFAPHGKVATISLTGTDGTATLGREGQDGRLIVRDQGGNDTAILHGQNASLMLGARGHSGTIAMVDGANVRTVHIDAAVGSIELGAKDHSSNIAMKDRRGEYTVALDGDDARLSLGSHGKDGQIKLYNKVDERTLYLDASNGGIELGDKSTIRMDGSTSRLDVGLNGSGPGGHLVINHAVTGKVLEAGTASQNTISPGFFGTPDICGVQIGNGTHPSGFIIINDRDQNVLAVGAKHLTPAFAQAEGLNASARGIVQVDGRLNLYGEMRSGPFHNDLAEAFVVEDAGCEPGTVMVVGDSGALRPCMDAFDRKVAGVLSGAGGLRPALVLGDAGPPLDLRLGDEAEKVAAAINSESPVSDQPTKPLALAGKVYCKVDASSGPIEPGDLLTTSATPGHAMKADDPMRAFGAIIGKALEGCREGRGLIPILVSLQ